jgi:hypothetical protein
MKLGGIFRDIFLYSAPEIQIKDVFLDPNLDENYENALLQVGVDIASYKSAVKGYTLDIEVFDSEGKSFISNRALGTELIFEVNKTGGEFGYYLANGGGRVTATAPKKWDAENPNLYTAVISLKNEKGEIVDTTSQKFGFREAGFATDDEGNQIFILNGKPIKFYGVIYNEHDADTGALLHGVQNHHGVDALKRPVLPFLDKRQNFYRLFWKLGWNPHSSIICRKLLFSFPAITKPPLSFLSYLTMKVYTIFSALPNQRTKFTPIVSYTAAPTVNSEPKRNNLLMRSLSNRLKHIR